MALFHLSDNHIALWRPDWFGFRDIQRVWGGGGVNWVCVCGGGMLVATNHLNSFNSCLIWSIVNISTIISHFIAASIVIFTSII